LTLFVILSSLLDTQCSKSNFVTKQIYSIRFNEKESVSSVNTAKNSVSKSIKSKVTENFECAKEYLDKILPKKEPLKWLKCHDHIDLFADPSGEVLFFRQRDGPFVPTLRLLHKYPFLLPQLQVDRGAIKHVLNGSNIMCPGLTSPGAKLCKVPANTVVSIMAEGKEHAVAVGITTMSTDEMLDVNKNIGVETLHYLNDGLWLMKFVR
uniref:PUA domain-containing protein n=1 Tax=Rodentolepis nana TaxID=102285 RepID=A0A0R3T2D9_RODNA